MMGIFFIIQFIFPTAIDIPILYYWHYQGVLNGFIASWPLFLWGFIITLLILILQDEKTLKIGNIWYEKFTSDESSLYQCFIISITIGIIEEITYRWLFFYSNIILAKIINFCLFGWCRYLYLNIEAPIINILFFNKLKWLLFDQVHWSIGSAIVIANGKFRDQHIYLGFFGYYNSWCIGFFEFWIMMNYGLPAAIGSHAFYDYIIFSMYYIHGILLQRRKYNYYYQTYTIRDMSTCHPNLIEPV